MTKKLKDLNEYRFNKKHGKYYILAGEKDFKNQLEKLGIYTDKESLLMVEYYSKLGKMIREYVKNNKRKC